MCECIVHRFGVQWFVLSALICELVPGNQNAPGTSTFEIATQGTSSISAFCTSGSLGPTRRPLLPPDLHGLTARRPDLDAKPPHSNTELVNEPGNNSLQNVRCGLAFERLQPRVFFDQSTANLSNLRCVLVLGPSHTVEQWSPNWLPKTKHNFASFTDAQAQHGMAALEYVDGQEHQGIGAETASGKHAVTTTGSEAKPD